MNEEIERKWIVDEVPETLPEASESHLENRLEEPQLIDQWYVISEDGSELRVRRVKRNDTQTYLTVKRKTGKARDEIEFEIRPPQALKLIEGSLGKVRKTRHEIMIGSLLMAEVDVYRGDLNGLVVAEVEFPNGNDENFEAPDWFGKQVTGDGRYKNKNLATNGLPQ